MEARALRGVYAPLVVIAAAVALGVVAFAVNRAAPPETEVAAEPGASDIAAATPEAAVPAGGAPDAQAPAAESAAPAPVGPADAPSFDVVRVAPDGAALVAGTAAPGAEVTIYAGDDPIATATADADGDFVALFDAEPSATPQALTLAQDGRRSEETVMLLPAAPEAPDAPGGATGDAGALPEAPEAVEPVEVAATAIVRADSVEVVPAPGSGGRVTLGSISYAEAGDVTLAGVGNAGATLRAYVDDRLASETAVGPDGRWSLALDDVAAGLYRLRIDEIAADGRVASRVETPFQRDFPTPLPRPGAPATVPAGGTITVQPGNNLWTIAQTHYGSGVLYTQIFTANRDLIRDPELIYPGQIFAMPEVRPARTGGPAPRPTD